MPYPTPANAGTMRVSTDPHRRRKFPAPEEKPAESPQTAPEEETLPVTPEETPSAPTGEPGEPEAAPDEVEVPANEVPLPKKASKRPTRKKAATAKDAVA